MARRNAKGFGTTNNYTTIFEKVSDATQTAFATPLSVTSTMCATWTKIGKPASLACYMDFFLPFFVVNASFGLAKKL